MSESNLDSLLDMNLDDLADLPEFKVFPAGAHRCTLAWESKSVNDKPSLECKLRLVETVEFADPSETPMEAGTESSMLFQLQNEFSQGKLKEVIKPLAEHFGVGKLSEVIEASKGVEVLAITKQRMNKDKTQTYLDIVKLQVL